MKAKPPQPDLSGMLLVDKPSGITSHDAVDLVRKNLGFDKVGHTGTLDPMATGLLIMLLGPSTKYQAKMQGCSKTYTGIIKLGVETDTWDAAGKVVREAEVGEITPAKLKSVIGFFTGKVVQQVPPFSAVRYKGKHMYKLARRNIPVPAIKREVNIRWERCALKASAIDFEVECSGGTYVRSIAHEVGRMLGTCAHLTGLRRTRINNWSVESAVTQEELLKAPAGALAGRLQEIPQNVKEL